MSSRYSNTLITGIILLIISILVLVVYVARYKIVSFKKPYNSTPKCNLENFANSPKIDKLDFDESLFDHLMDSSQYGLRINQIQNEKISYENERIRNLRDQTKRDKIKGEKMAMEREANLIDHYRKELKNVPNIIKSIKANSNNQILSTVPVGTDNYQIKINDKCLTVYDDNKYILDKCNESIKMGDSQIFSTKRIHDLHSAKVGFGKNVVKKAQYPYNVFISKTTDQCLALDNDGVTVVGCNPNDNRQHFKISGETNICPLA